MQKTKPETHHNVVPFVGYLQPQTPPPTTEKQTAAPSLITFAVLLFLGGIAFGAISVHQSADFTEMQSLKSQAQKLSQLKKEVCGF